MIAAVLVLGVYVIDMMLLFTYGANLIYITSRIKDSLKKARQHTVPDIKTFPVVTIQLPIFNEEYVAERLIDHVMKIDYPKDKLHIQVLDDSTDDTVALTRLLVNTYKSRGFDIELIHRAERVGQKGGALREAMEHAKGEYIAVFDADFVPTPEILKKAIPYFVHDPGIGLVQTRWGHLNPDYSPLTKAQAIAIDAHFAVEQVVRNSKGFFINFNGTAGVWRKSCIIDAGNWQDDTLTEDLDLSFRAELKGWKMKYLVDIVNPAELPVQINAYKSQQFRWAKGSMQTALKLAGKVLTSDIKFRVKFQAMIHLSYYTVHPLLILNLLLTPVLMGLGLIEIFSLPVYNIVSTVLGIAVLAPPVFSTVSQIVLYKDWWRRLAWIPLMMLIGSGVAVNNTRAWIEAVIGKKSSFIRTPKLGLSKRGENWRKKRYKMPVDFAIFFEVFLCLYSAAAIVFAVIGGYFILIPYLVLYSSAFGYVSFLTLQHGLHSHKEAVDLAREAA